MVKVIITDENIKTEEGYKYPYIGISQNGTVIFFIRIKEGICLKSSVWKIGQYRNDWAESDFSIYRGKLILSNE